MNPIVPPPAVATAGPTQPVSAATAVASFTNLPPGLANLMAGAILNGSVLGRDGQGHVLVQTPNGVLSLATALALAPGNRLSLQVQTVGAQIQMVVLSINQQPLPAGPPATAVATPPAPPAQPAAAATAPPAAQSPAVLVSAGTLLTATIVEPALNPGVPVPAAGAAQAPAAAAGQAGGQAGGQASASVAAGQAPLATAAIPPGTPPHEALQILTALFGRPGREAEAPQKGTRLPVRIVAFEPNAAADPQAVMRAAAQGRGGARLMPGTVLTPDSAGQLRVQTPLGQLSLPAKLALPPQSQLVFEILGPLAPPHAAPDMGGARAVAHGRGWPALEQALQVLSRSDPEQFRHLTESVVPRAGGDLAKMLILTAAALKSGHFAAFLGERTLRALADAGHHDLAARLTQDVRQLAMPAADPSGGEWRSYLIPVHDGSHLQFIRMYTRRRRRQGQDTGDGGTASRFLVEVDLSRLGALQFDGLVKAKKFDLIIRSPAALDSVMRREISRIFSDSLATSGLMGSVAFQAGERFAAAPARAASATVGLDV